MLRPAVSQTPTEPPSPRTLARARARGDLPYASELPIALVLLALALALVGGQPIAAFVAAFQGLAQASWGGQLSLAQASAAVPGVLQPLFVLLAIAAFAALAGIVAQRAPTLQSSPHGARAHEAERGRPEHGRVTRAWLTGLKLLVLGASLCALVYDSAAGWLATSERSAAELLAISGRVLPALLVRAAWVCVLLAGLELTMQYIARMRRLRMTRQQLQDEQRELAGDPRLLAERRSRAQSPQLMAADLAQLSAAALVITGSSCVVALEYMPERGVPRVWLSAQGNHALELLSRAYNLELPIIHDELLALALSRTPLTAAIPLEHHARVAQLLIEHGLATPGAVA